MVARSGSWGTVVPSVLALFDQADYFWPNRARAADGTIGDYAHSTRTSDHNPDGERQVHAGDITEDDANGPDLKHLWKQVVERRDPRVKYMIYEGRIVKSYVDSAGRPAWIAQPYTGTNAHSHHLHISVLSTPAAENDTSPWFEFTDAPAQEDDLAMYAEQLTRIEQAVNNLTAAFLPNREVANHVADLRRVVDEMEEDVDRIEVIADENRWNKDALALIAAAVNQIQEGNGPTAAAILDALAERLAA